MAQGVGSVTGSVVLFALAAVEHSRDKNVSGFSFLFAGCVLFCFGFARAVIGRNDKLLEASNNPKPAFWIEVHRLVYSDSNSLLLAQCTVINRSPKAAGILKATLVDRRNLVAAETQAFSGGLNHKAIFYSGIKRVSLKIDENGYHKKESVAKESIVNLFPILKAPVVEGVQEKGWFAFFGIPAINADDKGPYTFGLTLTDTLGHLHGPVDLSPELEVRDIL